MSTTTTTTTVFQEYANCKLSDCAIPLSRIAPTPQWLGVDPPKARNLISRCLIQDRHYTLTTPAQDRAQDQDQDILLSPTGLLILCYLLDNDTAQQCSTHFEALMDLNRYQCDSDSDSDSDISLSDDSDSDSADSTISLSSEDLRLAVENAARTVYATLGSGHTERVYHNAMEVELSQQGIQFDSEHTLRVMYADTDVGSVRCDLLVNSRLVVELKATSFVSLKADRAQAKKYQVNDSIESLLINFGKDNDLHFEFFPCKRDEAVVIEDRDEVVAVDPADQFKTVPTAIKYLVCCVNAADPTTAKPISDIKTSMTRISVMEFRDKANAWVDGICNVPELGHIGTRSITKGLRDLIKCGAVVVHKSNGIMHLTFDWQKTAKCMAPYLSMKNMY